MEEDDQHDDNDTGGLSLSQHPATYELSQSLPAPRETERNKLSSLPEAVTSRAVTSLSRLLLFKALSGMTIDRRKCVEEGLGEENAGLRNDRVSNALMEEAERRLRDVFGFSLEGAPNFMANGGALPNRYLERYYVTNRSDDPNGDHAKFVHAHPGASEEKGLLVVVLALAYCKGTPLRCAGIGGGAKRNKRKGSAADADAAPTTAYTARWIADEDLWRLLNSLDESIPADPPGARSARRASSGGGNSRRSSVGGETGDGLDVESLLDRFVAMDYLLKEKTSTLLSTSNEGTSQSQDPSNSVSYAMGPRAALEIGRRQLVYFCADILGEEPDPTMMAEINDEAMDNDDDEEEDEEEY